VELPDPKDKAHILKQYREAVELIGQRRLADGAKIMRLILDEDPQMTDVWSQYAAVLVRLGRLQDAFAAYQQVIRLNPEDASGPLGAASTLLALNRVGEARAHAELAVSSSPALAHQALANIAVAATDYDEALRQAAAAEQADPELPVVSLTRGIIEHRNRQYEQALPHLMKAREAYARRALQPPDLHFLIGDSLANLERYKEAEPYLVEEVRLYPQSIRARAGLVLLYQSTGRTDSAARGLDDMLRASSSPEAYATAAKIWRMFGEPRRAAAVEQEARRRFGQ
jgi:tetratricopeptide (TPR) repeat protein